MSEKQARRIRDLCPGSGRVLDAVEVQNKFTGQVMKMYTCPVCGASLTPLRNSGSRPHTWQQPR